MSDEKTKPPTIFGMPMKMVSEEEWKAMGLPSVPINLVFHDPSKRVFKRVRDNVYVDTWTGKEHVIEFQMLNDASKLFPDTITYYFDGESD